MLTALYLTHFKCFRQQRVSFAPLTLLAGANSSGKSSVLQALLLLQQSLQPWSQPSAKADPLSEPLRDLGSPQDLLYGQAVDDFFSLVLEHDGVTSSLQASHLSWENGPAWTVVASKPLPMRYLGPERAVRTSYPIPTQRQLSANAIGCQGEFAPYLLHAFGDTDIPCAKTSRTPLLAQDAGTTLRLQTQAWLSKLGRPLQLRTERPAGTDSILLRFFFPDLPNTSFSPAHAGLGLTSALPVFVAALGAPAGSLLLVENPEAYVHARGQAVMGNFFARAASSGIQVIIKTHSEHILNGIRVAVRKQEIAAETVQINFFQQQAGKCNIVTPRIDAHGHIDLWPEDFFDEWEKQLLELL